MLCPPHLWTSWCWELGSRSPEMHAMRLLQFGSKTSEGSVYTGRERSDFCCDAWLWHDAGFAIWSIPVSQHKSLWHNANPCVAMQTTALVEADAPSLNRPWCLNLRRQPVWMNPARGNSKFVPLGSSSKNCNSTPLRIAPFLQIRINPPWCVTLYLWKMLCDSFLFLPSKVLILWDQLQTRREFLTVLCKWWGRLFFFCLFVCRFVLFCFVESLHMKLLEARKITIWKEECYLALETLGVAQGDRFQPSHPAQIKRCCKDRKYNTDIIFIECLQPYFDPQQKPARRLWIKMMFFSRFPEASPSNSTWDVSSFFCDGTGADVLSIPKGVSIKKKNFWQCSSFYGLFTSEINWKSSRFEQRNGH